MGLFCRKMAAEHTLAVLAGVYVGPQMARGKIGWFFDMKMCAVIIDILARLQQSISDCEHITCSIDLG